MGRLVIEMLCILKCWFYRCGKPVVDMLSTSSYLPNLVPKSLNSFIPSKNIYVYDTFPFSLFNPFYYPSKSRVIKTYFHDLNRTAAVLGPTQTNQTFFFDSVIIFTCMNCPFLHCFIALLLFIILFNNFF